MAKTPRWYLRKHEFDSRERLSEMPRPGDPDPGLRSWAYDVRLVGGAPARQIAAGFTEASGGGARPCLLSAAPRVRLLDEAPSLSGPSPGPTSRHPRASWFSNVADA